MKKRNHQEITTRYQDGFTLLEMLVTISILAAIAFITTGTFQGVREDANDQLVRTEMQAIAKAIRQFKQDTGYYPGTGPFDLVAPWAAGSVTAAALPVYISGGSNAEIGRWFYSPANFYQLLSAVSPLDLSNDGDTTIDHQLEVWNPETGRGWRGPYLTGFLEYTDIGDGLGRDGSGDMANIATAWIENVPSVADQFEHRPTIPGSYNRCQESEANNTPCLLDWRPNYDDGVTFAPDSNKDNDPDRAFNYHGRPYLYFDDPLTVGGVTGCRQVPCLLSSGSNGVYDWGNKDDLVLNIK